ncbi:tetratricopeptide repeat protein [Billgrantia aerodenitrificans]|uniref:Sel1 repeat family protein n=1 Tax=Billgrantia aerodenitrificans TaxID=2733483 RepID=A0ABS9AYD4_9GAMM|nr:tetratricopeptide repeat protein [Halomonas aerodenitrificans]MCE8026923.1 sel1 repeat family protein [Halomonas aerodenitrificans]
MSRLLVIALLGLPISSWALEPEVQTAKDEGMRIYGLGIAAESIPLLEPAAEAGDVEAMYYLGEIHRLRHMGLTRDAMAWYLQAAEQGDVHAMLRLFQGGACTAGDRCPEGYEDWHHAALAVAQPKADAGDPDAMLQMSDIYRMFDQPRRAGDWLERAAEAGQPEAQTILGNQILDGRGWYLTNGRRLSAAEAWFSKAAEQGHVPGMEGLARVYRNKEEFEQGWQWMIESSLRGSYQNRLGVGWCYLDPSYDQRCHTGKDVVKGWAVLYSLSKEFKDVNARDIMSWNQDELTESQRQEAEALAEAEWIGREPPLSNFPPRFGY